MKSIGVGLIWIGWGIGVTGASFGDVAGVGIVGAVGAVCAMLASIALATSDD